MCKTLFDLLHVLPQLCMPVTLQISFVTIYGLFYNSRMELLAGP